MEMDSPRVIHHSKRALSSTKSVQKTIVEPAETAQNSCAILTSQTALADRRPQCYRALPQ